jgi:hypothetical protein
MNAQGVTVSGANNAPWFPNMAEVMDRDVALLDQLASDWAESREDLELESFLSTYLPDEVVGRELSPDREALPFGAACWLMFLHGYWGGVKLGRRFRRVGAARGAQEGDLVTARWPTEESMNAICAGLATVHAALAGSEGARLAHLDASLRAAAQTGTLYGTAYNTGFFEPLLYHPPRGALPEQLTGDPGFVIAAADRLLDIQYSMPRPDWLEHQKLVHERARIDHPSRWEAIVTGDAERSSLTEIWADGYKQGVYNWGGDTVANWKQHTLDAFLEVSVRFNFQVEAISHAVMAAVVDPRASDLEQATRASALFVPSWLGTGIGISDELGERPTLTAT